MGRKRLPMQKIENKSSCQVTFAKRKDGIVKKSTELSILCGADIGFLMFSPKSQWFSFASSGRAEDVFIRWLSRSYELGGQGPRPEEGDLIESLTHLKHEQEMLEQVERVEAVDESIHKMQQQLLAGEEMMRFYNPDVEKLNTVLDAKEHEQFLLDEIQKLELLKAQLLDIQITPENPEASQAPATGMMNADPTLKGLHDGNTSRNLPAVDDRCKEPAFPARPQLTSSYRKAGNPTGEGTSRWFEEN